MASPVKFPEANIEYTCADVANCESLFAWTGENMVVSKWRLSLRERLSVLFYGTVWLSVMGSTAPPPMALEGQRTLFEKVDQR